MSKKIWVTLIVVVGILSVLVFSFVYKKTSNSERYQKEIVETLAKEQMPLRLKERTVETVMSLREMERA